jgi:hypothetical protein
MDSNSAIDCDARAGDQKPELLKLEQVQIDWGVHPYSFLLQNFD